MLDPRSAPLCPGCAANRLWSVGAGGRAAIWICRSCQGTFATTEAVARVGRTHGFGHPLLRVGLGPPTCRSCKSILPTGDQCPTCDNQLICCMACAQTMERVTVERLTIDVCRTCRAVWLDRGELGALVTLRRKWGSGGTAERRRSDGGAGIDAPGALDVVAADALLPSLDLGEAVTHGVAQAPELVAHAGEGAITAVQVAGEAAVEGASSVAGVVLELLAGLFDGL